MKEPSSASYPVHPLGDVEAGDLEFCRSSGNQLDSFPSHPKAVFRELVAVTAEVKENVLIDQFRVIDCDDSGVVGHVANLLCRCQFDKRNRTAGLLIRYLNYKCV